MADERSDVTPSITKNPPPATRDGGHDLLRRTYAILRVLALAKLLAAPLPPTQEAQHVELPRALTLLML